MQKKGKKKRGFPWVRAALGLLLLAAVWKALVFYRFQWYGAEGVKSGVVSLGGEERELTEEELDMVVQALLRVRAYPWFHEVRDGVPGHIILRGEHGSVWNFEMGGDQMSLNFVPYKIPEEYQRELDEAAPYLLFPWDAVR